jgi:C4-dicarboxylate transporter DctM subunit
MFFLAMILLVLSGIPVGFAVLLGGLIYIWATGIGDPIVSATRAIIGLDSFVMMAIPLYILAGAIMTSGGMAKRLEDLANVFVGHLKGGLAHVNILASMIFAGMSGTASADAAGVGQIEVPMMIDGGYTREAAAVVTAFSATIGPIIPPSVPFVIYGALTGTSVGSLFLGGFIPGTLMGISMMFVVFILARRYGYKVAREKAPSFSEVLQALRKSFLALLTPVIIMGGIVGGLFTPTEAAAVAVFYALVVSVLIYKELSLRDIPKVILESMVFSGLVMFIIATATFFGWVMLISGFNDAMLNMIYSISTTPWVVLLIVNIVLLGLGCVMETAAIIIMVAPMFMPLILALNLNPVHFGIMMVLNLMIGMVTPPVGMCMYITCHLAKVKMTDFAIEGIPYYIILIIALMIITYIPSITMFLPNLLIGR